MKLRFVKFLTSRENEIEKKEGGGRSPTITCSAVTQSARSQTPLPFSPSSLHHFILPPPPGPTSPLLHHSQFLLRHGSGEQCPPAIPPPAVLLLPSFFIKLPKQQSVAGVTWRSTYLADPAVAGRASSRTLAPSSNRMAAASLRSQWHPLCGERSHRKTKYENELSCFITFIDE